MFKKDMGDLREETSWQWPLERLRQQQQQPPQNAQQHGGGGGGGRGGAKQARGLAGGQLSQEH